MVHVRSHHPLQMYVAGKSKPETGMDKLVVLGWKGNEKTGRKAHSARCFSLPVWTPDLQGADKDFVDLLVEAVEVRQKQTAHKYVTQELEANGGVCVEIPASLLEPRQILADYLDEESSDEGSSRGKLSSVQIGGWFTERLAPLVMLTLADKKGWMVEGYQISSEQEKQLQQASAGYRATLERLAAPQPKVEVSTAKQLLKAVELLGEERKMDVVARKLERKLEAIINPPSEASFSLADL